MRITESTLELIFNTIVAEGDARELASIVYPLLAKSHSWQDAKRLIESWFIVNGNAEAAAILPSVLKTLDILKEEGFTLR